MINMSRNSESQHTQATPHFDGEAENIINDPTASAGGKMGIQVNSKMDLEQEKTPFNYTPNQDPDMMKFEKLMSGQEGTT